MSNSEFTYLLKEIIELKMLNEATSDWKIFFSLIPLIASIITSVATIYIAFAVFEKTTNREKVWKKENDLKEHLNKKENKENEQQTKLEIKEKEDFETYRKIYGRLFGLNTV